MPAFLKAGQQATARDRADVPGVEDEAMTALGQNGVVFSPMPAEDRLRVKAAMAKQLYADFATRFPLTAPLFDLVAKAQA